ncbi:hypothetical protein BH09VER1_BH09VER1_46330 [soil metagenome]
MTNDTLILDRFGEIAANGEHDEGNITSTVLHARTLPLESTPGGMRSEAEPAFQQAELAEELAFLRERYAGFASSFPPAPAHRRPQLPLLDWTWRLAADATDFPSSEDRSMGWKEIRLPHYGGPVGRARAFYVAEVTIPQAVLGCVRQRIVFRGADYIARVYLDGRFIGQHEGFFAPFAFDLTGLLREGVRHVVLVELLNDSTNLRTSMPDGSQSEGDKIYAATGPGWDDPEGWNHCPPGMGIYQDVFIEGCAEFTVSDLWVRTLDYELREIEVTVEVDSPLEGPEFPRLTLEIFGENIPAPLLTVLGDISVDPGARRGTNVYRFVTKMPYACLWDLQTPWLYRARATLRSIAGEVLDQRDRVFGVREFRLEEEELPKGRFFLNGREIRLFGANTMGFEQQDVMRSDLKQLHEDFLLAKAARLNFFRFTQRPLQTEVYDCCDRLGILAQCDFPLFAGLRRGQLEEAMRQVGEMARLVRGHACTSVLTYINEPFPEDDRYPPNRYLSRREMEGFFAAADQVVRFHFPDAVIKAVEGDYAPPGPGLPDEHCYNHWYNGHLVDAGALHAGGWPDRKPEWNYSCGEFGAEGLDFASLMRRRYPAQWLPGGDQSEAQWTPSLIPQAQTGKFYGFFFEAPTSLEGWVEASQRHQERATRMMTEAFRRNPRMVSFAIHLFIDAWPSGWMKAIVDCERRPKPAFYAYRDALSPTLGSLRTDRFYWFEGDTTNVEAWVCRNDVISSPEVAKVTYCVVLGELIVAEGSQVASCPPCSSRVVGQIRWTIPPLQERTVFSMELSILDLKGRVIHMSRLKLEAFPALRSEPNAIATVFNEMGPAKQLAANVGVVTQQFPLDGADLVLVDDPTDWAKHGKALLEFVRRGGRCLLYRFPEGAYELADGKSFLVETCWMGARHFAARSPGHPLLEGFREGDFQFWYSELENRIAPLAETCVLAAPAEHILQLAHRSEGGDAVTAGALTRIPHGKGDILIIQLDLAGGINSPIPRELISRLMRKP